MGLHAVMHRTHHTLFSCTQTIDNYFDAHHYLNRHTQLDRARECILLCYYTFALRAVQNTNPLLARAAAGTILLVPPVLLSATVTIIQLECFFGKEKHCDLTQKYVVE
jgi:hypothetical protein